MSPRAFLRVPGAWLDACGLGNVDKVFPVLDVEQRTLPSGERVHFVGVEKVQFGAKVRWVVLAEWRGATFQAPREEVAP